MASSRLIAGLASTAALSDVFSDANVLGAMLDFECALARAQAKLGLIPQDAAAAVIATADAMRESGDTQWLIERGRRAGTFAIPLAQALQAKAEFAHWGATSQDVIDTALVLLLRQVRQILQQDHVRLAAALRRLSDEHAATVMPARTLLQPAPPVTFGLKCAQWLAAIERSWGRVSASFDAALCVQLGGASGTLAALSADGAQVAAELARELALEDPQAPWHTQRERLAGLIADVAIYAAALGKMALDIALLMQAEVAEAFEPGGDGRGGSSAMPHKRNPTAAMLAISAARQTPGLAANFLQAMLQEHERAVGGWQAEWAVVEGVMQCAGVALASMVEAAEGLRVDAERMRANIPKAVFAERAMALLAREHGRERAREMVERMLREDGGPPAELCRPEDYLGCAELFRKRLLGED